ncbi:MAG: hypothetical protein A2252_08845 [Elusimicrobia bacterium RIFOXYA2_FULL_39_19]|nr:MAG: hypothetical protein A2252_08845 [Elusimicrobia bacterium RIFOXYA2_FULL_39_19]
MKKTAIQIALLASMFLIIGYFLFNNTRPDNEIILTIPPGRTGSAIASILYENKLILNKKLFLFMADLSGSTKKFQTGTYKFNLKNSLFEIINMLKKGKTYAIKVTIPEGFTSEQIADILADKNLADRTTLLNIVNKQKLEGYLFPETYYIPYGASEEKIVSMMKNVFDKNYSSEIKEAALKNKMSGTAVITLASIIEKEAKTDEERGIISGVFYNRLKKSWMLESCATVRYALKKYDKKVIYKDLNVKSPYNTYRHPGLPPGPICNPGLASIKAAVNPAQTDMMFFFATGDGNHEFSKYYRQHIERQKNAKTKK